MRIVEVKAEPNFRVFLRFETGESGSVDLSEFAGRGVFAAWLEPGFFDRVAMRDGTIVWPDDLDLCPDSLYLRLTGKQPEELFPALRLAEAHA
jgi:hypothetical protein